VHELVAFLRARAAEDRAALTFFDDRFGAGDRWVAECDAKWRIIELIAEGVDDPGSMEGCEVLLVLGMPYARHRDYRAEWQLRTEK
jgi:hypothetical protein